jgi:hypothetical protein
MHQLVQWGQVRLKNEKPKTPVSIEPDPIEYARVFLPVVDPDQSDVTETVTASLIERTNISKGVRSD